MFHTGHRADRYPTTTVLRDLASQEGCDGEPYDQMIEAADQIEEAVVVIRGLRDLLQEQGCGGYTLNRAQACLDMLIPPPIAIPHK